METSKSKPTSQHKNLLPKLEGFKYETFLNLIMDNYYIALTSVAKCICYCPGENLIIKKSKWVYAITQTISGATVQLYAGF